MTVPPEMLVVQREAAAGSRNRYRVCDVLSWFQISKKSPRHQAHAAMLHLRLQSKPVITSASIKSTVVFYLAGEAPPKTATPHRELNDPAPLRPTLHSPTLPPKRFSSSGPAVGMQMLGEAPPSFPAMRIVSDFIRRREPGKLVVSDAISVRELAALMLADDAADAIVIDDIRNIDFRVRRQSVLLALAAEDGGLTVAMLCRGNNRPTSEIQESAVDDLFSIHDLAGMQRALDRLCEISKLLGELRRKAPPSDFAVLSRRPLEELSRLAGAIEVYRRRLLPIGFREK